ncbi:MAG TPA: SMP-30/gluconolactonase/LRE family protein [Gammaproteobacteria bacterium]|nr:SMP-30/gluconolactonase/LRE family protein [Gammaproteobacteria bacterium]
MNGIRLLKSLPVANALGESVLWDELGQAFYWTDILGRKLYRYRPDNDRLEHWDTPQRLCSFGFVAGDDAALIAAFESGIALYQPASRSLEWLARPEADVRGTRFNDGRVDRQGRFWSGTMIEDKLAIDAQAKPRTASLYRVTSGACAQVADGLRITNSLCWSLDSRRLYLADSPAYTIYVYDFDAATGLPANRRIFAQNKAPIEPDGSCIDAEDHLWNAQWRGGKVTRYRPDGVIDTEVLLPVTQPTCVCFGGPELNWLAVTSAHVELSVSERKQQPLAGALFIFETPYKGLYESRYSR